MRKSTTLLISVILVVIGMVGWAAIATSSQGNGAAPTTTLPTGTTIAAYSPAWIEMQDFFRPFAFSWD